MSETAYIGLGSNLEGPASQILHAFHLLHQIPQSQVIQISRLYQSPPMGPPDQPWYVNAVVALKTELSPEDLLSALQAIELRMGRVRQQHWGPRRIDLDLLVMGDTQIDTGRLKLPHPGISERSFVLQPLTELAPNLNIPGLGSVQRALQALNLPALQTV